VLAIWGEMQSKSIASTLAPTRFAAPPRGVLGAYREVQTAHHVNINIRKAPPAYAAGALGA